MNLARKYQIMCTTTKTDISSNETAAGHSIVMQFQEPFLQQLITAKLIFICNGYKHKSVASGGAVGRGTALKPQVRFPMTSLEFFIDIILLAALWHWG
jgi:hypothetical protein